MINIPLSILIYVYKYASYYKNEQQTHLHPCYKSQVYAQTTKNLSSQYDGKNTIACNGVGSSAIATNIDMLAAGIRYALKLSLQAVSYDFIALKEDYDTLYRWDSVYG
jgi:hypothetical protein